MNYHEYMTTPATFIVTPQKRTAFSRKRWNRTLTVLNFAFMAVWIARNVPDAPDILLLTLLTLALYFINELTKPMD